MCMDKSVPELHNVLHIIPIISTGKKNISAIKIIITMIN